MKKRVKMVIGCIFLAIAILYPTYAIIETVRDDFNQMFIEFGWNNTPEGESFLETTTIRHQISMYALMAIQVVCIAIFSVLILAKED